MTADSKAKLLEDAERYVLQGKVHLALAEYQKIVELDPDDVLILNTIGDLYLRQKNVAEANRFFSRVAEAYVNNNFFLKAIAVYKKILSSDPDCIEVNSTMASLYAKHGLGMDACRQYQRVIELLEREGKVRESLEIYEKIVEIDPLNVEVRRKLAQLHLGEGNRDKALQHWVGAAQAQAKAGDAAAALVSYRDAIELDALNLEALKGYFDCALRTGEVSAARELLEQSVAAAPDNPDLREMLGRACMETGDMEAAVNAYQVAFSLDEGCYQSLFAAAATLIEKESYDRAIECLDRIVPTLIARRETGRAVDLCEQILEKDPGHAPSMVCLASIHSATGDSVCCQEVYDRLAGHYMDQGSPMEALEFIEKILRSDPGSEKHRKLHYEAFTAAYPDVPYEPPPEEPGGASAESSTLLAGECGDLSGDRPSENVVEVDLLLNYGLKDKALSLLENLERRNPCDKEVRVRLLSFYKSEDRPAQAAEQCLLLAALYRAEGNEAFCSNYLAEAGQLDPVAAGGDVDLDAYARSRGIDLEAVAARAERPTTPPGEVDLSGDLLEAFMAEGSLPPGGEGAVMVDAEPGTFAPPAVKSLEEQFQEVDFYIRLGFEEEAHSKLSEIALAHPDHPELASRYEKLSGSQPGGEGDSAQLSEGMLFERPEEAPDGEPQESFEIVDIDAAGDGPGDGTGSAGAYNEMFADLMDEVHSPESQAAARAAFEERFSLGIAYRDMDLIDDAIKEFEAALKGIEMRKGDPLAIQCCGMLSTCFLKKNMPRSVIRWCQTGLDLTEPSSHEALAFRYDMGVAHSLAGSTDRAIECFDGIFNQDPGYRDVAQRIDELRGGPKGG
ncbi:MAG: tetratricopeptide repeat protein [Acidobacteria bacterium]|nr:tetratricopeptide repeat protein [Acidobacteriota bacterium]